MGHSSSAKTKTNVGDAYALDRRRFLVATARRQSGRTRPRPADDGNAEAEAATGAEPASPRRKRARKSGDDNGGRDSRKPALYSMMHRRLPVSGVKAGGGQGVALQLSMARYRVLARCPPQQRASRVQSRAQARERARARAGSVRISGRRSGSACGESQGADECPGSCPSGARRQVHPGATAHGGGVIAGHERCRRPTLHSGRTQSWMPIPSGFRKPSA